MPPMFWGGALTLAIVIAMAAMATVDFNAFFTQFHVISFANDFWLLDPATDYLIMLFPGEFWRDAVVIIGYGIGLIAVVTVFISWRNLTGRRQPS